jgi:hypothetical protein
MNTSSVASPSAIPNKHKAVCSLCNIELEKKFFSKTQLRKKTGKKCTKFIAIAPSSSSAFSSTKQASKTRSSTVVKIVPRPQRDIPGFEGVLTCCTDWPQTKRGEPPSAQSAVFNPLLACCLGPIEGHSTQEQLDQAFAWWSAALPAWGRWVNSLQVAGVVDTKSKLLARAKGRPNPLIHKARGHGTVPHFRGRDQSEALELDAMVAIEVYQCVATMYSTAALERMERDEERKEKEKEKKEEGEQKS